MTDSGEREKVHFSSDGTACAAWLYRGTNGACVVMSAGLAVTKEPGTDRFARRLHDAGYTVLAFDYRRLGESGGRPRQVTRYREQLADWHAAIDFARNVSGVDPHKIAIWGYSLSGGHVFRVAAGNPTLGAAIAHSPLVDGVAVVPNAMRHQTQSASLRFAALALVDAVGLRLGRRPILVPLAGPPGTLTSLTTPDAQNGAGALNPGNTYPHWQQEVAASSAMRAAFYRPGRHASRIRIPFLVIAYDDDGVAPPGPTVRAASRAPRGELARLPGGHYAAYLDGHEQTVDTLLAFLSKHLLDVSRVTSSASGP
ncbi:alpha/beta hydrolase [Mycobacterium kubicae]|uniref:Alpha/beta fold hydrolase n=1 Tax=Mycobacterium kubicae TaxID=120959 RepID=A0AAX1JC15_9MYCO|nr:alpha/beta fold hydrolase [Mycobacterium kubicae]MCV7096350.1 alpha/beta fold hydrolase [Mycobacterium kubicae]ORW05161.1 alpha/beta hydrolase [Mycobacterium kubicae]QNI10876.1 alpha/beta hydrolase [Mycobacterium kubicae]QPI39084.1 alpha/beta fold hydrolase [Mycobacterium kubicae]GFG63019.1 alpha/beta hydrolase [Mycobacterium kubicae]